MIVTGVGSRRIDETTYRSLLKLARWFADKGWHLRSGAAKGADSAWEEAWEGNDQKTIYLPEPGFRGRPKDDPCYRCPVYDEIWFEAEDIAQSIHSGWAWMDDFSRKAHTRNVFQVLGDDLRSKADLVVACAPPKGRGVDGGTATAYRLGKLKYIPTFNFFIEEERQQLFRHLQGSMGNVKQYSSQSISLLDF